MALYLGGNKVKIILNNQVYNMIFPSVTIMDGVRLLSSDNYILQDTNGLYLTFKEEE